MYMKLKTTEKMARKAYEAVVKALKDGKLDPEIVLESTERLRQAKEDLIAPYEPLDLSGVSVVGCEEHVKKAAEF